MNIDEMLERDGLSHCKPEMALQITLAKEVVEQILMNDGEELDFMMLLDSLAIVGAKLEPCIDVNITSLAYISEIVRIGNER